MIRQCPSATLPLTDPQWQQWLQELLATGNALKSIDTHEPESRQSAAPANPQTGPIGLRERDRLEPGER